MKTPTLFNNLHELVQRLDYDQGCFAIAYHVPGFETTDYRLDRTVPEQYFTLYTDRGNSSVRKMDYRTFSTAPFDELMSGITFEIGVEHDHDHSYSYPVSERLFRQLQQLVPLTLPTNKHELTDHSCLVHSEYVNLSELIAFARASKVDALLAF